MEQLCDTKIGVLYHVQGYVKAKHCTVTHSESSVAISGRGIELDWPSKDCVIDCEHGSVMIRHAKTGASITSADWGQQSPLPEVSVVWLDGAYPTCRAKRDPGSLVCGTTANDTHAVYVVGRDGLSLSRIGETNDRINVLLKPGHRFGSTQPDDRDDM